MPHSLAQAVTYWTNRRRQLERCQANHPRSYEIFLSVKQSAGGSAKPPDDTWDNGQLYRLHMIQAQAARDVSRYTITEEDVDNYLIHAALSDRHRDITDPDVRQPDHSEHQTPDVIELVATSREHPGPFQGCEQARNPSSEPRRRSWRPRYHSMNTETPLEQGNDRRQPSKKTSSSRSH
jgi:hypothetical protein